MEISGSSAIVVGGTSELGARYVRTDAGGTEFQRGHDVGIALHIVASNPDLADLVQVARDGR